MPFQLNLSHGHLFQWVILFCLFFVFLFLAKKLIILNLAHVFKKTRTIIDDLFIVGLKSVHLIYLIIIFLVSCFRNFCKSSLESAMTIFGTLDALNVAVI